MKAIQQITHTFETDTAILDAPRIKRLLEYAAEEMKDDGDNGHMVANIKVEITDVNEITIIEKYRVTQFSDLCADAWEHEIEFCSDLKVISRTTRNKKL